MLWQNLDALGEFPTRPSDAWLRKPLEIAHAVFERKGVLLPESNDSQTPVLGRLAEIYVRPYQKRSTSNTSEAALGWEVKHVPMPERNLAEPRVETEEPTFGTGIDRVSAKQHSKVIRDLGLGGWSPLTDLADPDHVHFEAELGHAVSIIHLTDEADGKIALVNRPGEYRPAKGVIIEHMHDMGYVAFEIGRHAQALETAGFVQHTRRAAKQRSDLEAHNTNRRGEMKDESYQVIDFMRNYIRTEQIAKGLKENISEAARAACEKWPARKMEANRRLYYDWKKSQQAKEDPTSNSSS